MPLEISKYILDFFLLKRRGMDCLEKLFFHMLLLQESAILKDPRPSKYIKSGQFVVDCFGKVPLPVIFELD